MDTGGLLINAEKLHELMLDGAALVFDCRFDLAHPRRGYNSWLAAHIPGAIYAHLDDNLSGRITPTSGRHPLPLSRSFAAFLARSGWTAEKQVVAYDGQGGVFAARLWWLMRYFGLGHTSILDGGIGAWMAKGYPMESGSVKVERKVPPRLNANPDMLVNTMAVLRNIDDRSFKLIDARPEARFEGREESIDPVAGHVPGALNRPTGMNLGQGSRFRDPDDIASQFRKLAGKVDPANVVHMCGSGVTACHNQFAMELAGMHGSRVYVGSWSEWIRDPMRPVVQGQSRG